MAPGGSRLLLAVLVAASFEWGCGDGNDVVIDIRPTVTPGAVVTATPARTATAARTATPVATATPAGPTATSGGPTASPTPGGGGSVDADVQSAVGDLLPFFTIAGLTTGVSSSSAASTVQIGRGIGVATEAAVNVANCPNGGTRTQDDQLTTVTVTLAACRFTDPDLGSFQFDGTITASLLASSAAFNVTAKDLNSNRTVTFTGSVTGTPQSGGGFKVNGGPITIATTQGNFTLTLANLTVDGNGNVVSGGGTLTDDNDLFDLAEIAVTIRSGGATADLHATFDDNSTKSYVLDLKKGSITPAS